MTNYELYEILGDIDERRALSTKGMVTISCGPILPKRVS